MMPVSLLIALLLAFGIEPAQPGVPQSDVFARVLETFGGVTLVAALAFGLGLWVSFQVNHSGSPARGFDGVTPLAFGFSPYFRSLFSAGLFTRSGGPSWCAPIGGSVD